MNFYLGEIRGLGKFVMWRKGHGRNSGTVMNSASIGPVINIGSSFSGDATRMAERSNVATSVNRSYELLLSDALLILREPSLGYIDPVHELNLVCG